MAREWCPESTQPFIVTHLVCCGAAVIEPGTIQSNRASTLGAVTLFINGIDGEGQRSLRCVFLPQRNAARGEVSMGVKKCLCVCANRRGTNGHVRQGGETCKHTMEHTVFPPRSDWGLKVVPLIGKERTKGAKEEN